MAIPVAIPLVGGASPWVLLGPVAALSVAAGWVMAQLDRGVPTRAIQVPAASQPEKELAPQAA
jgi:hypothetical protein